MITKQTHTKKQFILLLFLFLGEGGVGRQARGEAKTFITTSHRWGWDLDLSQYNPKTYELCPQQDCTKIKFVPSSSQTPGMLLHNRTAVPTEERCCKILWIKLISWISNISLNYIN